MGDAVRQVLKKQIILQGRSEDALCCLIYKMNLSKLLLSKRGAILSEATTAMSRAHFKHYEDSGVESIWDRLEKLYDLLAESVKEENIVPVVNYSDKMARDRFNAGDDLQEVQTAINMLEECIWKQIVKNIPKEDQAEAIRLTATILGNSKDVLARTYVELAVNKVRNDKR